MKATVADAREPADRAQDGVRSRRRRAARRKEEVVVRGVARGVREEQVHAAEVEPDEGEQEEDELALVLRGRGCRRHGDERGEQGEDPRLRQREEEGRDEDDEGQQHGDDPVLVLDEQEDERDDDDDHRAPGRDDLPGALGDWARRRGGGEPRRAGAAVARATSAVCLRSGRGAPSKTLSMHCLGLFSKASPFAFCHPFRATWPTVYDTGLLSSSKS